MDALLHDLRYAIRTLRRQPGFALTALLTLAVGIGANVAIFSAVNGVLLRPLSFVQPERLIRVWGMHPQIGHESASLPDFLDWRAQAASVVRLSALSNTVFTLTGTGEPEMIPGAFVTADFFRTLGVAPLAGRGFAAGEDTRAGAHIAVLGEGLWRRRFGGDPGIVGRTIRLDGRAYDVVGVVPASARIQAPIDVWTPLVTDTVLNRRSDFLHVIGRLAPGASLAQARQELATVARRLADRYPDSNTDWSVDVVPLRESVVGPVHTALLLFLLAVGLVLLIACANVANLMVARAAARERELVVRTALGASRRRLIRQLLTESVLLALAGGGLGVLLAGWGVHGLTRLDLGTLPRADEIALDGRVLVFALALSVTTGVLFGLVPALRFASGPADGLRDGGRAVAGGRALRRIRSGLVLGEVALAFVLLIGAGLLVRSFDRLLRVDPGFRSDGLLTARLLLPGLTYPSDASQARFLETAVERLAAVPSVRAAAAVSDAPLGDAPPYLTFSIQGQAPSARGTVQDVELFSASPSYFETLGMPLVQGRLFEASDRAGAPAVALVNQAAAHRYFGGRSPLGARITFDDPADTAAQWMTVVGLVGDIHHAALDEPSYPQVYLPIAQAPGRWMVLVARAASGDPIALAPVMRRVVGDLDPSLALSRVGTMDQRIAAVTERPRLSALVLGSFAAGSLLLAALGIYGVVSYAVVQRTRELGIRMALGAAQHSVVSMVVRQGMAPVAAGLGVGLAAAWVASRVLQSLLFGVGTSDPVTFLAVTTFLSGVALLACYLPARRAALSDPNAALRAE
ncbi:MAG: ABC transporter permease [Gemmatimonadales bacterium]